MEICGTMQTAQLIALGLQYHQAGSFAQAEFAFRQVLDVEPLNADAWCLLGVAQRAQLQAAAAIASLQEALRIRPDFVEARINLGNVFAGTQRWAEAIPHYRQALKLKPDHVGGHTNLGIAQRGEGELQLAVASFRRALRLNPRHVPAHVNLADALLAMGRAQEALDSCQTALRLQTDFPQALMNKGLALSKLGRTEEALDCLRRAVEIQPDYLAARINLGNLLFAERRYADAQAVYEAAACAHPDSSLARYSVGLAQAEQGQFGLAVANYQEALRLEPARVDALQNLGVALLEQLKLADARQVFERLRTLRPAAPAARLGLAACYLVAGDFERGWPEYEARLRMPGLEPKHNLARWAGEPLAGRSLLLLAEQGLGDTLHFIRFARLFKQRGARVVLAAQAALGRLLASHPDLDELFLLGSAAELPRCDFYLPLLSVPGALGTTAATIPCEVPYLWADAELTDKWRVELAGTSGLKIGIAWQGSREFPMDRWRSIPLAHFAPLASLPDVRLISLQKGFGSEQAAMVDFPVLDLSGRLDEVAGALVDTAAVIRGLDLVVTSDTAIAHLAGALGAAVWVALPYAPNWRWLLDRDESPWYPTMRLFRQTTIGGWPEVFERIAQAIEARRAHET
jgi:tetratricopeptide (TPR) repeat protein